MRKWAFIHPFLFALFFILALYSANVTEVSFRQVVLPIVVVLGSTVLLVTLAWVDLRDIGKVALAASVLVVLCFSYGHVVNLLPKPAGTGFNFFVPTSGAVYLIFLLWIALAGVGLYLIRRSRRDLRNLTSILCIVGLVLVIIPVISITVHGIRGATRSQTYQSGLGIELQVPESLPDIYYIVPDRYASAGILNQVYGFDNSEFVDYLCAKGFYVAPDSRSNYHVTEHSLASSLNMDYLDRLSEEVGESTTDQGPIYAKLQDYEVWRLLKSVGYEFVHLGSWWEPTRENKYADMNINYRGRLSEFSMLLLRTSVLDPIGTTLRLWGEPRRTQWERVRYKFDKLSQMPEMDGPKFVFAHFLVPHPEYVFDSDGSFIAPLTQAEVQQKGVEVEEILKGRYIRQLEATNSMLMSLIDSLLTNSDTPPIIILQSDEGPYPREPNPWSWDEGTPLEHRQKVEILNAYYLPGINTSVLYPSITPVNSFRIVFNMYFGTDLELLADRNYIYEPGRPYQFRDVTEEVR